MRNSRSETAKTRERIVTAAAAEFRQHGIAATGLDDLMKAAGLTHGGFYRHFKSKQQLVAEACSAAVATTAGRAASGVSRERGRKGLETAVADYLSAEHRDNPRDGCPLAALGSEMARADPQTRAAATAGFLKLVDALAGGFDEGTPDEARRRATVAALTMIGAVTISRVVTDQALSNAILRNAEASITRQQTTEGKKAKRPADQVG